MRTTINLDERLLEEAMIATGEKERTRLIHDGLHALIERENARAIVALRGTEPNAWIPERRRSSTR